MPPTPVTAETYAQYGYPFFKLYEEPSDVFRTWENLLSIAGVDKANGKPELHESEANLAFPVVDINTPSDHSPDPSNVELNTIDEKSAFLPVRLLEDQLRE